MKILLISDEFPPFGGGAGYVGKQILDGFFLKNYQIDLLTNHKVKPYYANKFKVLSIYRFPIIWILMYLVKFLFLNWNKYDRIIINDANSIIPFCFFLSKKVRAKSIIIIHGTTQINNYYYRKNLFFSLINFLFKQLLKDVRYVIGVSNFMTNYVGERYRGLENLIVWNPGVDYEVFLGNGEKKNNKSVNLLSVSRVVEGKGYKEMYEVFKNIIAVDKGYVWNIVGDGDYKENLINQINDDNLNDYIFIHDKVERKELTIYYEQADVFFLLSNFEESLGLVYLEAQYFGLPCIANDKGGPKEIINIETGFLINNSSEAVNILLNKDYTLLNSHDIHVNSIKYNSKKALNNLESLLLN